MVPSGRGATVGISGYSNFAPGSQTKFGQQSGNGAVLLVLASSNLHLGLAKGSGPQSSTNSSRRGGLSSERTQVERPQNGVSSQVLPGSTVAHLVLAKHMPGKSVQQNRKKARLFILIAYCRRGDWLVFMGLYFYLNGGTLHVYIVECY